MPCAALRQAIRSAAVLLAFGAALAGGREWRRRIVPDPSRTYIPSYQNAPGMQLVMVYLGSANCAWSNAPWLSDSLDTIKLGLRRKAHAKGWSFWAVGAALDWSPEVGVDYLRRFGRFDEIAAGGNWANGSALTVLDGTAAPASTPQVVVLLRQLRVPDFDAGVLNHGVSRSDLVVRKAGLAQIQQWHRNGLPLPGYLGE